MKIIRIKNSSRGKKHHYVQKSILILDENIKTYNNHNGSKVRYFDGELIKNEAGDLKSQVLVMIWCAKDSTGFDGVYVTDGNITL